MNQPGRAPGRLYPLYIRPTTGPIIDILIDMERVALQGSRSGNSSDAEVDEIIRQIQADARFRGVNPHQNRALLKQMVRFMGSMAGAPGIVYPCPGTISVQGGSPGAAPEDIARLTREWQQKLEQQRQALEEEKRRALVDADQRQQGTLAGLKSQYEAPVIQLRAELLRVTTQRDKLVGDHQRAEADRKLALEQASAANDQVAELSGKLLKAEKRLGDLERAALDSASRLAALSAQATKAAAAEQEIKALKAQLEQMRKKNRPSTFAEPDDGSALRL